VSEWILNGTYAQLGHTVPLISCWKMQDSKRIKNTENAQIKYSSEKADDAKYSKTKLY